MPGKSIGRSRLCEQEKKKRKGVKGGGTHLTAEGKLRGEHVSLLEERRYAHESEGKKKGEKLHLCSLTALYESGGAAGASGV